MTEPVLGIWDGHDAGAALVQGEQVLCAVNEERLTRRKLEVGFPTRSIAACLSSAGLDPPDVRHVACSTTDVAKTLTRLVPALKERYYLTRRRKRPPGPLPGLQRELKYALTMIPGNRLTAALSRRWLLAQLRALGLVNARLMTFDHHLTHAAAAFFSGFEDAVVVTIDGIGDGRSGSLCDYTDGNLRLLEASPGACSLGLFFEQVTHLLHLRELEDEGKVMALAAYAPPREGTANPLAALVRIERDRLILAPPGRRGCDRAGLFRQLQAIHWGQSNEQFAACAQEILEWAVEQRVNQAVTRSGRRKVVLAGGVASNVRANRCVRLSPEVEDLFVFPHMGDGGLALGAAALANHRLHGVHRYALPDHLALGPGPSRDAVAAFGGRAETRDRLASAGLSVRQRPAIEKDAAALLAEGEILLWMQGAMEYGPRALGGRSILARADRPELRDRLNRILKRRAWYQPFCPSLLAEDAAVLLEDHAIGTPDRFMTCAYRVREEHRHRLAGVIGIDGTCRPQILEGKDSVYKRLLHRVRALTGTGAVLNTSLNRHGEPLIDNPEQALDLFREIQCDVLVIGDALITKEGGLHGG
jgi:carbamoyltransferase